MSDNREKKDDNKGSLKDVANEMLEIIFGGNRVKADIRTDDDILEISTTPQIVKARWIYYGKVLVLNNAESTMSVKLVSQNHANPEEEEFLKSGPFRLITKFWRIFDNIWYPSSAENELVEVTVRSETNNKVILNEKPNKFYLSLVKTSTGEYEYVLDNLSPLEQESVGALNKLQNDIRDKTTLDLEDGDERDPNPIQRQPIQIPPPGQSGPPAQSASPVTTPQAQTASPATTPPPAQSGPPAQTASSATTQPAQVGGRKKTLKRLNRERLNKQIYPYRL